MLGHWAADVKKTSIPLVHTTMNLPQTSSKPPPMLLIWLWTCFCPGQQRQMWISLYQF